jgi:hypothetical protein
VSAIRRSGPGRRTRSASRGTSACAATHRRTGAARWPALELALEVRHGDDRAITLCNLANVHAHGAGEQRAAHVEAALRCYREALELLHPDNAETRAAVLFNLAPVLVDGCPGDRGESIEAAIDAVQEALALGLPERDALAAKLVLANALGQRLTGSRTDSLERALALVEEVVAGRDPRADPYRWANAHNSRGILFSRRLRGGRADNIEEAVASFRNALGVYRPELYARDRAGALNNLATVLWARPLGNREANETEAIGALHEALEVYDRATDPYSWAGTMSNLGTAHFERRTGDPHDNVGAAIDAYEQALEVRTEAALPWEWAATMFNLGQAYWRRYRGDRTASLDLAARSLRAAMRVRTPTAAPEEWAGAQSMLALVLDERSQLDRPELLEDALRAYEAAATVYEPEAFPYEARANANNLAGTLLRVGRYEDAWRTASTGLRAAELLYDAAPTEEGREIELNDNARLYRIAAEAALLAGRPAGDVFEIAERGRGRLLRDWLAASSLPAPPAVDAGLIDREQRSLEDLRAAILVARSAGVGGDRARSVARAASARAALERVWAQIESQPGGAPYVAERRGSRLRAAELQDWPTRSRVGRRSSSCPRCATTRSRWWGSAEAPGSRSSAATPRTQRSARCWGSCTSSSSARSGRRRRRATRRRHPRRGRASAICSSLRRSAASVTSASCTSCRSERCTRCPGTPAASTAKPSSRAWRRCSLRRRRWRRGWRAPNLPCRAPAAARSSWAIRAASCDMPLARRTPLPDASQSVR